MTLMSAAGGNEIQMSTPASQPDASQLDASQPAFQHNTPQPDSTSTSMPPLPTLPSSTPVPTSENTDRSLTSLTNRQDTTQANWKDQFINASAVTSADGTMMVIASKPRKPRCDKGTKRGPQENNTNRAKRKNKEKDTAQRKKKKSDAGPNVGSSS